MVNITFGIAGKDLTVSDLQVGQVKFVQKSFVINIFSFLNRNRHEIGEPFNACDVFWNQHTPVVKIAILRVTQTVIWPARNQCHSITNIVDISDRAWEAAHIIFKATPNLTVNAKTVRIDTALIIK